MLISNLNKKFIDSGIYQQWVFGAAIFMLALIVRLIGWDSESLWGDEIITLNVIALPLPEMIADRFSHGQAPLFFLLAKMMSAAFGSSRAVLLAPNIIFGALAAPILAAAAREAGADRRASGFAGLLVALSPMLVCHSQELRPYPLMIMLGAATLFFYLKSFKSHAAAIGLSLSLLLFGLTHPSASILSAALFISFLINIRKAGGRAFGMLVAFAAAGFPLLFFAVHVAGLANVQMIAAQRGPWAWYGIVFYFLFTASTYAAGSTLALDPSFSPADIIFPETVITALLLLGLLVAGIFLKTDKDRPSLRLPLLFFSILALAASTKLPVLTQPKYLMFSYPLYYLVVSAPFSRMSKTASAIIALIFFVGFSTTLYRRYLRVDLPQWREAAGFAAEHSTDDELVAIGGAPYINQTFAYYYKRDNFLDLKTNAKIINARFAGADSSVILSDAEQKLTSAPGVWYIFGREGVAAPDLPADYNKGSIGLFFGSHHQTVYETERKIKQALARAYPNAVTETFKQVEVSHYFSPAKGPADRE